MGIGETRSIPPQFVNHGYDSVAISQPRFTGPMSGEFYGPMAAEAGGNIGWQSTTGPTYFTSGIFAARG